MAPWVGEGWMPLWSVMKTCTWPWRVCGTNLIPNWPMVTSSEVLYLCLFFSGFGEKRGMGRHHKMVWGSRRPSNC